MEVWSPLQNTIPSRSSDMTPRARVETVLRGEWADHVPFTAYENKVITSEAERMLRNEGLCIVLRSPSVYTISSPNVRRETTSYTEKDVACVRTIVKTPVGELSAQDRPAPEEATTWHAERLFKRPEDYRPLEFMIRDLRYSPNYEAFSRAQEMAGGDCFLRAGIGYEPLHEIMYSLMGIEQFSIEWAERRDEVMRLYEALVEDRRKIYPIVAKSPALAVNYGGNVSGEVVGLERFCNYYVPHYIECADILHANGKLLGVHLDANNRLLAEEIGRSGIDYVEAFTPEPDCDMTVAEARTAWPDKILWINFPSSLHLSEPHVVEEETRQILREAAPGDRFLIGITENVPPDRWRQNYTAISRVVNSDGRLPIH